MGVVYHANYFVWFEVGRSELLRALGWSYREMEDAGVQLPVIEAHVRVPAAGRYDDELEMRATAEVLSPVRIAFDYEIVRLADGDRAGARPHRARGRRSRTGSPCRLPDRARTLLS